MSDQQPKRQSPKHVQTARYVVYVDNQGKSSFDSLEAAEKEAKRIRDAYPILNVRVADSEQDSSKTLGPTREPD